MQMETLQQNIQDLIDEVRMKTYDQSLVIINIYIGILESSPDKHDSRFIHRNNFDVFESISRRWHGVVQHIKRAVQW